jgi:hypothetical protein
VKICRKSFHFLTKQALKEDEEAAKLITSILSSLGLMQIKVVEHMLVYQIVMNMYASLSEECKKCGGFAVGLESL